MPTFRTGCCQFFMSNADKTSEIPGIGNIGLERLLGCPAEHLEFHLWYLKEKGWIRITESGMFVITAEGVDHVNSEYHRKTTNKLLTDQSRTGSGTRVE